VTFSLTYPTQGRGSFATGTTIGGTLSVDGTAPGSYYRAPANTSVRMPGLTGALALRNGTAVSINDYAVFRAVVAIQGFIHATPDGILGNDSARAIWSYQKIHGLTQDGIVGPATCRTLLEPLVASAATGLRSRHSEMVRQVTFGTITVESGWDIGAVGQADPQDLGIGQINGPAHPSLSVDSRFDPAKAIKYVVNLVDANLKALNYDEDAGIAAYNLGVGGAKAWLSAGSQEFFHGANVWAYIKNIKAGM
jgi:peptidoglycan hydrolase-like protein with peptidoglycan-binding domain